MAISGWPTPSPSGGTGWQGRVSMPLARHSSGRGWPAFNHWTWPVTQSSWASWPVTKRSPRTGEDDVQIRRRVGVGQVEAGLRDATVAVAAHGDRGQDGGGQVVADRVDDGQMGGVAIQGVVERLRRPRRPWFSSPAITTCGVTKVREPEQLPLHLGGQAHGLSAAVRWLSVYWPLVMSSSATKVASRLHCCARTRASSARGRVRLRTPRRSAPSSSSSHSRRRDAASASWMAMAAKARPARVVSISSEGPVGAVGQRNRRSAGSRPGRWQHPRHPGLVRPERPQRRSGQVPGRGRRPAGGQAPPGRVGHRSSSWVLVSQQRLNRGAVLDKRSALVERNNRVWCR